MGKGGEEAASERDETMQERIVKVTYQTDSGNNSSVM